MLSAGVHAALAHAHHDLHSAAVKAAVVNFGGPIHANLTIAELGINNFGFNGSLTKGTVTLATGKAFSLSFKQTLNVDFGGVTINSVTGAIKGKVTSINGHVVQIAPTGKITVSITAAGHKLSLAIVPKPGVNSVLTLDGTNSHLVSLVGTFKLPTNAFLNGGDVNVTLTPN